MIRRLTVLAVLTMLLIPGCNDEPEKMSDHKLEATTESGLPPASANPSHIDDSYTGAAAAGPAAVTADQPDAVGDGADIVIDDSTPEALANTFVALINAGQIDRISELLVQEQREAMEQIAAVAQPAAAAVTELQQKSRQAFPDAMQDMPPIPTGGLATPLGQVGAAGVAEVISVEPVSATEATAVVGAGPDTQVQYTLRQVDGTWRMVAPDMATGAQLQPMLTQMQAQMEPIAQACRDLISRLDAGEFATAEEFNAAFIEALQNPPR